MGRTMRFRLLLGSTITIAACLLSVSPAGASDGDEHFVASTVEDFAFLGCPAPVGPFAFTCGTAKTQSFGKATVETVLLDFFPNGAGCFVDIHESTLTFHNQKGSIDILTTGTLCPTGGPNFMLEGTFVVSGGTGRYTGATGTGTVRSGRQDGPILSRLEGTLVTP
jgi:hypothetical protein